MAGGGALLRRYREAAGLSQDELAERAGLSTRGISDLERGLRRRPYPATLRRLAQALSFNRVVGGFGSDRRPVQRSQSAKASRRQAW